MQKVMKLILFKTRGLLTGVSLGTMILMAMIVRVDQALAQAVIEESPLPAQSFDAPSDVIAILGAFPEEVRILRALLTHKKEVTIRQSRFTTGTLHGARVVVAFTGIGKVNAATTTMLVLEHFQPRVVIFTGIAGGINPDMKPGDIVIGSRIAYHDYGTLTPAGMQRGPTRDPVTQKENPVYFACDSSWVKVAERAARKLLLRPVTTGEGNRVPVVKTGVIVTGDVFVASDAATKELRANMNADATEMEGAAVAQVSYQQQVPFVVIRSMSDNAGNNASHDVKSFYSVAASNSAALVAAIAELDQREHKK